MLIKGGVTLITRGFGQTVTLEPYLFAEVNTVPLHAIFISSYQDPDYPELQCDGMEFRWFCRQLGEQWPADPESGSPGALLYEDGDFIPNDRLPDVAGGCFGNGPS